MHTEDPACVKIDNAIAAFFADNSNLIEKCPYGNGHINDTFLLRYKTPENIEKKYILQRMNHNIFKNPQQLMENVVHITEYLRQTILSQGGDPDRETLNVWKTLDGANWYQDSNKNYWRVFPFIENSICLEKVESEKDFYDSAVAFGNFQKMLADFPVQTLHETIPNFHNTVSRFQDFKKAIQEADKNRATLAKAEIAFALDREQDASIQIGRAHV